jgi:hypothetical protein
MMLMRDHALFFSLFSQALFGHFFKGLVDHLVLNHKQLLSVERENHKVNPLLLCALTLFLWLQIVMLLQQFACCFFDPGIQVLQSRGELHEDAQARYDEARKCDHNLAA